MTIIDAFIIRLLLIGRASQFTEATKKKAPKSSAPSKSRNNDAGGWESAESFSGGRGGRAGGARGGRGGARGAREYILNLEYCLLMCSQQRFAACELVAVEPAVAVVDSLE